MPRQIKYYWTTEFRSGWVNPLSTHLLLAAALLVVLAISVNPVVSAQPTELDATTTVIRAHFDDRSMVDDLARDYAPWEVNHDRGYLVIGVNDAELQDIKTRGFRVEIEPALTSFYETPATATVLPGIPGYPCYRTVEETYASARQMATEHATFASWIDIGDSWRKINGAGGYDLRVLKLTNSAIPGPKPKIFHMTSVHAREYTPAELNTRFAEYLLDNYGIDADATWLLDHHEFHLLLQANPDGRKEAETGQLWRKNYNQNACLSDSSNRGIDLNRNFPFRWGCCGGSTSNQCAQTYRGTDGNSEIETQAITNYLKSIYQDRRPDNLNTPAPDNTSGIFLDTHSYSELVLWPWGFTREQTPNGAAMTALGRKLAAFNDYRPTQIPGLYIVDGDTTDFAYGDLGLASFSFELGTTFFQDCPTFENKILPDNLDALIYASKVARAPYTEGQGPDGVQLSLSRNPVNRGESVTFRATLDDTRYNNSNGIQATQNIAGAEVYIDVPPWANNANAMAMTATDGQFDEKVEQVITQINTSNLREGRHTLFVRGRDTMGNWGPVSAVFLDVQSNDGGDDARLSVSDVRVNESDGVATATVTLSNASARTVRVIAFTRAGSARSGTDYYGDTQTLSFAPGVTRQTMSVTLIDDQNREPTESMTIILVRPENAEIEDGVGRVTIEDNDLNTGPIFSVSNQNVNESVGVAQMTIRLTEAAAAPVSVLVFTQELTATAGQDFYGKTERINFAAGQTEQNFSIFVLDDRASESAETLRVRLKNASGGTAIGTDRAILTIDDND